LALGELLSVLCVIIARHACMYAFTIP